MLAVAAATGASPVVQLDRIQDFLIRRMQPNAKPKCKSVSLAHHVDGGSEVIFTHIWETKDYGDDLEKEISSVSQECADEAAANASTFPGMPQRYGVVAYGDADRVIARHDFMILPSPENQAIEGGMTEGPTAQGVLQQSMRLTEVLARTFIGGQHEYVSGMQEELQRHRVELRDMREYQMKYMRAVDEMFTRKWEYDQKIQKLEDKDATTRKAWGYVEQLVPPVLAKLTGGAVPEQASNAVLSLFQSLKPEQLLPMMQHVQLTAEQKQLLVEAMTPEQYAEFEKLASRQ